MAVGSGFSSTFAGWRGLLTNRNVVWLCTGQAISQIGEGLSKVALLWFVYDLTGSALKMTMSALFGLTLVTSFVPVALLIAAIGASSGVVNPFVSASLQERAPKDMLARVFSVFNTGTLVAAMVGMTACGWVADHMGPTVSLVATAAVNVVAAVLTVAFVPWCYRLGSRKGGGAAKHTLSL